MKKITFLLAGLFLIISTTETNAQDDAKRECTIKYNLFKGDYQSKKYDAAFTNWIFLMDNCPTLSVNIYKFGDKLTKIRFKSATNKDAAFKLIERVYNQRLVHYPNNNPAKVHSDYATFLAKNKLADDNQVFSLLEKAYKIDATKMGVKNIYKYFQGVTDRNKDTNPQMVFDTYDDVLESVSLKLADYAKKLLPLQDTLRELDKSEKRKLRAYTVNSTALGQVEGGLDNIIVTLSTCDRLIPLYQRDFEANKDNAVWLKRAVSRMYNKDCTEDPLYDTLVEALVKANPTPEASVFYAGILYKKGKVSEAMEYYQQAVDQEPDVLKKANNQLKIAQLFAKKGQKSKARSYANQALKNNPNLGKAYLVIASLYASSVNSCGSDEFEKRMTYVAALNKARRAMAVDPSISSTARRYIKNYQANVPSKKVIFTKGVTPGSSYKVGCWIGETVRVPK
jgi:tetratricopeptide (TPR) repeat protein